MSFHFKLTQSFGKHLSHGGFPLVQRLFVEHGLPALLDSSLPQPSPQAVYTASDVAFSFFYTLMMCGSCLEDLNYARDGLRQIKYFKVHSADTLHTRRQSWAVKDTESFSGPHGLIHDSYNYTPRYESCAQTYGRPEPSAQKGRLSPG